MKIYSQKLLVFVLCFSLTISSCSQKVDGLTKARNKLQKSNKISYDKTSYYPTSESDFIDISNVKMEILFNDNDSLGYNFIKKTSRGDYIYQDGEMRVVNHKDSIVRMYLPTQYDNSDEFKKLVERNLYNKLSPMVLLQEEWEYITDTIINNSNFGNYYQIENDKMYDGNKVYTERHIFINSNTSLLERFERRNYFNGTLDQRVTIEFSNYKLSQDQVALTYDFPENYISAYGEEKRLESLVVGDVAPEFNAITMDKDTVNLKMFRGKKVLLNFSVISCGYCKEALDYFNQDGYVLTDKIPVLYINPYDDETRMKKYIKDTPIPFPIIAEAKDISKKYRAYAYPRFFLINEKGIIEKIQVGFSKDFIDTFRQ